MPYDIAKREEAMECLILGGTMAPFDLYATLWRIGLFPSGAGEINYKDPSSGFDRVGVTFDNVVDGGHPTVARQKYTITMHYPGFAWHDDFDPLDETNFDSVAICLGPSRGLADTLFLPAIPLGTGYEYQSGIFGSAWDIDVPGSNLITSIETTRMYLDSFFARRVGVDYNQAEIIKLIKGMFGQGLTYPGPIDHVGLFHYDFTTSTYTEASYPGYHRQVITWDPQADGVSYLIHEDLLFNAPYSWPVQYKYIQFFRGTDWFCTLPIDADMVGSQHSPVSPFGLVWETDNILESYFSLGLG